MLPESKPAKMLMLMGGALAGCGGGCQALLALTKRGVPIRRRGFKSVFVEKLYRHEDSQLVEVAEGPSPRQPRHSSSRAHVRHQQDESPLQGAPGLTSRVRVVVFDVGLVLVRWDARHLYEQLIPDHDALDIFLRDIVTQDWHFQHDMGRPFAETSAELIARHPHHAELIAAWGPRFNETISGLVPGMAQIVADLAAADVPLYAITNFSGEFWPPFRAAYADLFVSFRDIVVSGDERLAKPDAAIYRLALARFGLQPGEGLFVDDRPENIEGANANGFVGYQFVDAPTLRARLVNAGLL